MLCCAWQGEENCFLFIHGLGHIFVSFLCKCQTCWQYLSPFFSILFLGYMELERKVKSCSKILGVYCGKMNNKQTFFLPYPCTFRARKSRVLFPPTRGCVCWSLAGSCSDTLHDHHNLITQCGEYNPLHKRLEKHIHHLFRSLKNSVHFSQ